MPKIFYPSTKALQTMRSKAVKARWLYEKHANVESGCVIRGWRKSPINPMELLSVFNRLSLKQPYVLRAYVFSEGENGNGIIWAMPKNAFFPEADECEKLEEYFLSPPKPDKAVQFENILIGNGRLWSYLEASLFIREAREFGAQWHGCSWSDVGILDQDPFIGGDDLETGFQEKDWAWKDSKPKDWRAKIIVDTNEIRVCFYTYDRVGTETINFIEDVYVKGTYSPKVLKTTIGRGTGGIVY